MVNPAITRPRDARGPTDLEIAVGSACATLPAPGDLNALIAVLREMLPGIEPRHALTRGGWHRLGGLVDEDGQRIAHQILAWAEAESGGDIAEHLLNALRGNHASPSSAGSKRMRASGACPMTLASQGGGLSARMRWRLVRR